MPSGRSYDEIVQRPRRPTWVNADWFAAARAEMAFSTANQPSSASPARPSSFARPSTAPSQKESPSTRGPRCCGARAVASPQRNICKKSVSPCCGAVRLRLSSQARTQRTCRHARPKNTAMSVAPKAWLPGVAASLPESLAAAWAASLDDPRPFSGRSAEHFGLRFEGFLTRR